MLETPSMLRYHKKCGKNAATADNQQGKIMSKEEVMRLFFANIANIQRLSLELDFGIGQLVNIGEHRANLDPNGSIHKGNAKITAILFSNRCAYADCTMRGCHVRQILTSDDTRSELFIS